MTGRKLKTGQQENNKIEPVENYERSTAVAGQSEVKKDSGRKMSGLIIQRSE